jgi:NADH-quinone oxidoreductase subunit A
MDWLYTVPAALAAMFLMAGALSWLLGKLSAGRKRATGGQAYACGEDVQNHMAQPDYGQFFPFAFFFTILHVVALMVTTVPQETMATFAMAAVYLVGAVVGLVVLYSR